jgi:hypothetical protein
MRAALSIAVEIGWIDAVDRERRVLGPEQKGGIA